MDKHQYHVDLEFIGTILGSQPQRDVYTEFINSNVPEDELEALPIQLEKATTAFHRVNGAPVLFNYQIKGFLKHAAEVVNRLDKFPKTKALKSKTEDTVFVFPRIVPLIMPPGGELTFNERPLRAETARGPRIALARSEEMPIGTTVSFIIEVLDGSKIVDEILRYILDYGFYIGIGQWRNAGHGSFNYRIKNA